MNSPQKILLAEDELLIAKVLRMQLERNGYVVENVTTEDDAVLRATEFQPDFVILDVFLKNKGSGLKVSEKIRSMGYNCPIIFTTGNSYESTIKEVNKITNAYLVPKPVEFEILFKLLKEISH